MVIDEVAACVTALLFSSERVGETEQRSVGGGTVKTEKWRWVKMTKKELNLFLTKYTS